MSTARYTQFRVSICQVISSNPDTSGSFILQWGLQCWPEDGKYKCLETLPTPESNRLDVFLGQLTASGSELKLMYVMLYRFFKFVIINISVLLLCRVSSCCHCRDTSRNGLNVIGKCW